MPSLIESLEENEQSIYLEVTEILLKIIDNILNSPENFKFRKLRLANDIVSNKLIPAIGVMEYLFALGFEEAEDSLVLPKVVPLSQLKTFKEELHASRTKYLRKNNKSLPILASRRTSSFLDELKFYSERIMLYEDKNLQNAAKALLPSLPLNELLDKYKSKSAEKSQFDTDLILLSALMTWFKNEFFSWMDKPMCKKCDSSSLFQGYNYDETPDVDRIEVYACEKCDDRLLFPRYNNPIKLLETRTGRCGEWANCFCLFCRSLGFETRFVLDKTDHVWTEVYSKTLERWIHCDPCENIIDAPLMYEKGWNKKLSYVIAFSVDEVQDVTWRYTTKFAEVRTRRNLCSEKNLLHCILKLTSKLQSSLSSERKKYLLKRRVFECIEFLIPVNETDEHYGGRISGSLDWRRSRGECKVNIANSYIWRPNDIEIHRKRLVLKYSTALDEYYRVESDERLEGWENGVYECESVIRKVENDWKMCYLCRAEDSNLGSLKWKFSTDSAIVNFDEVTVRYTCNTFENGDVKMILCDDVNCVPIDSKKNYISTKQFCNSSNLTLTVILKGGKGSEAWQHAQILRQSLNSKEYLFELHITLRSK